MVSRGFGLMGRKTLSEGGGLIIRPCSSVITFFMRFPIDVLFVDANGRVVHMVYAMRPWRTGRLVRASRYVVELPTGVLKATETALGDTIEIVPS
jgi:uncharacterized protein